MNDLAIQFLDAIRCAGLMPPEYIEPGKLYRFPGAGKRQGNTAGWCRLFDDGQGGFFGDWSTGLSTHWRPKLDKPYSCSGRKASLDRASRVRAQTKADCKARQAVAANRAAEIWGLGSPAPCDYPYLVRKRIGEHSARLYKGVLVLPVRDFNNKLTSLQFIDPTGRKRLLKCGLKKACFIPVSRRINAARRVLICEGWATGCTLAENDPTALVLAAIDAGNLQPVAIAARNKWPSLELVVAGDDDRQTSGNPGASKARAAAISAGALLTIPQWPADAPESLTDFNDLANWLEERK